MLIMQKRNILIGVGIVLAIVVAGVFINEKYLTDTHTSDEVHVHADFSIYTNDTRLNLTNDKYQSSTGNKKHEDIHLHSSDDHVVHRHAEGITFAEFLSSIGFTLTDNCFTTDDGTTICNSDTTVVTLYVNGQPHPHPETYITQEEDQVLLYAGAKDNPNIATYLESITDESCIFSGTCPERGIAPSEDCGLTCEI